MTSKITSITATRRNTVARATGTEPDSQASTSTLQEYILNGQVVRVPLGAVQQMPEPTQTAVFAAVYAALGLGTWASLAYVAPAIATYAPWLAESFVSNRGIAIGGLFLLAGVAHFTTHDAFTNMYPKQGAWGFWSLPGSPSFHVNWTGVAEILGGGALVATRLAPGLKEALPWVEPAAGLGLFLLTLAVTPANIYMFTHNAPGPTPLPVPWQGHLFRLVMQVVLLAAWWDVAFPSA
ncbi:hypothetical protein HYH03_005411 [Edaphochlamys debaryana]|uniref:Uncharacterized protein n=1 Tax=Edaphochlamys debaryana TaxID=47281 RepID=A0A835Y7J9_9CHLO|nr:hypothetical protein HYH03_005411 [Edaphochlamys debaryana]|eukprot:KAG2496589.1 hypothetical protein HYH03_005411 [Edaphochlamys debaryana]